VAHCSGSRASSVDTLTASGSAKKLTFGQSPIITVIGKAYWDLGHAPKEQNNHRKYMPDYAVWEIHPVMKLLVQP